MLYVHRSERSDRLVDALGDLLSEPLPSAMVHEVVAVPTRGVERWLTQRLSHRLGAAPGRADGVCANIDFPFPGTLVGTATAVACGVDKDKDPWPPARSVWPLLALVDAHLDDEFMGPLADHLRASSPTGPNGEPKLRRFPTVRHLADLYDHYAVHRPDLVLGWAKGAGTSWQAELWRLLRAHIGVPSPAERFEAAASRLATGPDLLDEVPPRLSVFGLTRLPASHLRVLKAISVQRDVHLFLLHPSGALWDKVAANPSLPGTLRRADDSTAGLPANTLLRSWGRDAREMQLVLAAQGVTGHEHLPLADQPSTLLGHLQSGIRADREPPGPPRPGSPDLRPLLAPDDNSLSIHACHGRGRQVEIVRDAVLHLLAEDPTLQPRDVIVMCPDIEPFVPLVQAAFGVSSGLTALGAPAHPGAAEDGEERAGPPQLRARLADRSVRQTNPLLSVADALLDLAGGRVTASQVLDLASRDPVSRRFGFDEEDLAQVERWLAGSGIRWGLDAEHRAPWRLQGLGANTWRAGLDRLLLGVAMAEDESRLFAGVLPFDDVPGSSVEVIGRLAELVARLRAALDSLAHPQSVESWVRALVTGTEQLALAAPADAWQQDQLHRALEEVAQETLTCGGTGSRVVLDLAEARALLAERLRGRPTRANFRTGDLTICTMVPMRSVPHRVVCLLGLDDGVFPRHPERDGDDLLLEDPFVGDRDPPGEDRQLLLDALLAAKDHLVITFQGRDPRTNQERAPAVPVAELLDVVDRTVRTSEPGVRARDLVVLEHPLQSFDPRNFSADGLARRPEDMSGDGAGLDSPAPSGPGRTRPWSFDTVSLEGARALTGERHHRRAFLTERLPPLDNPVVELESLVRFLEHPVKAFLRERLSLYAGATGQPLSDDLPLDLDGLERWEVGDRLLQARLSGAPIEEPLAAELARGLLPPGPLAAPVLDEVLPAVQALVDAVELLPCAEASAQPAQVNLRMPDGRSLVGTVAGVRGGTLLRCVYSRLAPKHRVAAWARFLALSAQYPEVPISAVTVGRGQGRSTQGPTVATSTLGSLPGDPAARRSVALGSLGALVDLYDRGMREPLPLYCATSEEWARSRRAGEEPEEHARRRWETAFDGPPGEDRDPEHVLVMGGARPFTELLTALALPDESGNGWYDDERSRFGRYARRLWGPLLDHEHLRNSVGRR
jgi:exodeoxyribonuclease V gamma subunit